MDLVGTWLGSLGLIFQWPTIGFLFLGVLLGFTIGILPGLGGVATIALLIPFVLHMKPIEAIVFLVGILAVNTTTGDVTSILFGIPGESSSAAVMLDGHPLAQQGQAGRALGASLTASLLGAWLGAIVLVLAVPVLRPIVLAFGPPELFMLTVLGLTFLATLSKLSPLKGLLMALFGYLVAMVGLDPFAGAPRFTAGQIYLWEGLSLVPVIMGLFAVPEILQLMSGNGAIAKTGVVDRLGGLGRGVRETFSHWGLIIRCSFIGWIIGIMPGIGSGAGQFIGYAHAQQTSKDPDKFGKGAIDGVIAPSCLNNATDGGDLVPTVAFGVPGSSSMALLLAALIMVGLVPGPDMLTKHVDLTFAMFWVIVVGNLIAVVLTLMLLRQLVAITSIRGELLVPALLVFVGIGAYSTNNDPADVIVMFVFGALGWAALRFGWPRSPFLLAFVLGQISERYLFLSTQLYGLDWLMRPIVLALLGACVLALVYALRRQVRSAPPPQPPAAA